MQARFSAVHPWVHILDPQATAGLARRMAAAQELVREHHHLEPCSHSIYYPAWTPEEGFKIGHFEVASCTTPGVRYLVSLATGCNCPDGTTRAPFGWCKHRLACWLYVQHLGAHGIHLVQESAQAA